MVKRNKILPKSHQQLFDVLNSTIEPWDGPAAICASDIKWAIAATDRNGLKPLICPITTDNMYAGSETGMVEIQKKIREGKTWSSKLCQFKERKIYKDKEIKDYLSKDYKQFNKQIIHLDKKYEFANFSEENSKKAISFRIQH